MSTELLIVDDEKNIADILCEVFEAEGIQARALYSGLEALDYYKNNQSIKVILSDIQMSNGSGIDLIEGLLAFDSIPSVIFMTGHTTYKTDELIKKGAKEVLSKPIELEILISMVQNELAAV